MWTEIENIELTTDAHSGDSKITVTDPDDIIQVGNWVVISSFVIVPTSGNTPAHSICEIRKIKSIGSNTSPKTLYFFLPLKYNHLQTVVEEKKVFIQTSPNWDILLFGANPDLIYPNRIAIQSATKDCAFNGGGIISIPKGTYQLDDPGPNLGGFLIHLAPTAPTSSNPYPYYNNIKYVGEGQGVSIIKYQTGVDISKFIFYAESPTDPAKRIKNLEFHNLSIAGNDISGNDTHGLGIYLAGCDDVIVSNVDLSKTPGASIKLLDCSNTIVESCHIHDCHKNGMTIQRDNEGITITGNKFENNKGVDIDEEPTGGESDNTPKKIIIDHNIFTREIPHEHSLEIMGKNGGATDQDYIITNNIIINGGIWMFTCNNMTFNNNYVFGGTGYAFQGEKANSNIIFNNNIIINNNDDATKEGFYLSPHSSKTTKNIQITSNQFVNCALNFENCHDVMLVDNQISTRASNTYGIRILLNANPQDFQLTDYGQVIITGNNILLNTDDLQTEYRGIVFNNSNSYRVGIIKIDNNIIESKGSAIASLQYGILINNAPQYWDRLLIGKGNVFGSNIGNTIVVEKNSYLTGMNPSRNQWIAEGSPENQISGQQGTTAIDKTREADNKYQLNSINGNKGWTLLSELGKQVLFEDNFQIITGTPPPSLPVDLDNPNHIPEINVLGNTWVLQVGTWAVKFLSGKKIASARILFGGEAIATVSVASDVEIKALFQTDQTNNWIGGLVFRFASSSSYGQFNLKRLSGVYSLELFAPGSSTNLLSSYPSVTIGNTDVFELKILLKGSFISVFYNDLLILSFTSNVNISSAEHGLITNTTSEARLSCQSFKILLR